MLKLAIFGQTGAGKTSLSNALFGVNWLTDHAVACTQGICQYEGKIRSSLNGDKLSPFQLLDTPGIGESEIADQKHLEKLYSVFHSADIIFWVVQADSRAFSQAQKAILRLTEDGKKVPKSHIFLILNQVDRVYPEKWNEIINQPSPEQNRNIQAKVKLVEERFSKYLPLSKKNIIPCSARRGYGLKFLVKELAVVTQTRRSNKNGHSIFSRFMGSFIRKKNII